MYEGFIPLDELKKICWKGPKHPFLLEGYFRLVSIRITSFLIDLKISADAVSFASLLLLMIVPVLIFLGPKGSFVASLLIFAYWILDMVDGEVARYYSKKGIRTKYIGGIYLDFICGQYVSPFLLGSLTIYYHNLLDSNLVLFLGVLGIIASTGIPHYAKYYSLSEVLITNKSRINEKPISNLLGYYAGRPHSGTGKKEKVIRQAIGYPGYFFQFFISAAIDLFYNAELVIYGYQISEPFKFAFLFFQLIVRTGDMTYLFFAYYFQLSKVKS